MQIITSKPAKKNLKSGMSSFKDLQMTETAETKYIINQEYHCKTIKKMISGVQQETAIFFY